MYEVDSGESNPSSLLVKSLTIRLIKPEFLNPTHPPGRTVISYPWYLLSSVELQN